jgi:hypothetical protein
MPLMVDKELHTNKTYPITIERDMGYLICWSKPPDLPIGNAGTIEVKP